MSTLAEDLLKTKPISELRVLIKQLSKDAEAKKSELRSTVGSQYHQFIQSADTISEMQNQSKQLLSSLELFWEKNEEFISQVKFIVNQKSSTESGTIRTQHKSSFPGKSCFFFT
jgi:hypothetical protein